MTATNQLALGNARPWPDLYWHGPIQSLSSETASVRRLLLQLDQPLWVVSTGAQVGLTSAGSLGSSGPEPFGVLGCLPALCLESLGDPAFKAAYGTRYAYYAGAMANAIASEDLVIALGKAGLMGSFGAGGCLPARIEAAIQKIQQALPNGPYAFNLLNSPLEPALETRAVELYLKHGVRVIEASAYMDMTFGLVYFRAAGLSQAPDGQIVIGNRIIAKISRKEVAKRFFSPAPQDILNKLVEQCKITTLQAELALRVPMADDVTVEADSGGHTDNRPLVTLIPAILAQRDALQAQFNYPVPVRVGAGGGIGTPHAVLGAFAMGAAYVVTGSVNQSCLEAGASEHTRNLLANADMADVSMAPASDMFEMGVKVQVLKRGSMFAPRAGKLYELYSRYNAWEEIPLTERQKLETTVFKRPFEEIWADTVKFFTERDPRQVERGSADPHAKMALVFRWYLGLSSRWSNSGEKGREMDYQIWCGPSMGAFNDWVRGTYLHEVSSRRVVDVALHLLTGAAYLTRLRELANLGVQVPAELAAYHPEKPLS